MEPRLSSDGANPARGAAALLLAGLTLVVIALYALIAVFLHSRGGQRVDEAVLHSAALGRAQTTRLLGHVLALVSVVQVAASAALVGVVGLARRRLPLAAAGVVLVGASVVLSELLKTRLLHRSPFGLTDTPGNSLPSGHTTVAISVAMAVVLVSPPRARPVLALIGAGYAFVTGTATLSAGWHRPSDVVASCVVTLAVGLALATWLGLVGHVGGRPSGWGPDLRISRLLGLLALAGGAVAALLAPGLVATTESGTAGQLLAYLAGVAAIGAATIGTLAVWLPVVAWATARPDRGAPVLAE